MRLIANAGPVLLQAQSDQLRVLGQKGVQIGASDGELLLHAPVIRLLAGDGSYLRLGGGIELGSEGAFTVHASTHDWLGPASAQAPPSFFTADPAEQQLRFHHEGDPADLVAGLRYAIRVADGTQVDGVTGADGTTERMHRAAMHRTEADALRPLVDAAQEGPTATGDPEAATEMGDRA